MMVNVACGGSCSAHWLVPDYPKRKRNENTSNRINIADSLRLSSRWLFCKWIDFIHVLIIDSLYFPAFLTRLCNELIV